MSPTRLSNFKICDKSFQRLLPKLRQTPGSILKDFHSRADKLRTIMHLEERMQTTPITGKGSFFRELLFSLGRRRNTRVIKWRAEAHLSQSNCIDCLQYINH